MQQGCHPSREIMLQLHVRTSEFMPRCLRDCGRDRSFERRGKSEFFVGPAQWQEVFSPDALHPVHRVPTFLGKSFESLAVR